MVNSSLSFNFLVVVVSLLKMAEASEKEAKKDANQDKCSGKSTNDKDKCTDKSSSTHDKDKTGKVMETKKKPEEVSPAKRPRLGPASKVGLSPSRPASSDPAIYFSGHHAYIVRVAQTCRASGTYTDVNIQCEDGEIRAHR